MDKLVEMDGRIDNLPLTRQSDENDKAKAIKCVSYGLLAIAYAIRELTELLEKGLNKKE